MNSDKVVGVFSLAFSFAYIVAAWLLPDAAIGNPMAPKYFPLGVGAIRHQARVRPQEEQGRPRLLGAHRRAYSLLPRICGHP